MARSAAVGTAGLPFVSPAEASPRNRAGPASDSGTTFLSLSPRAKGISGPRPRDPAGPGRSPRLKVIGRPDGDLPAGFDIDCYHKDFQIKNADQADHLTAPHPVETSEGPHDDRYFRVGYSTISLLPQGYAAGQVDEFKDFNFLTVEFRSGVVWKNNTFTGKGRKVFVPPGRNFEFPGRFLFMPDFEVHHVPHGVKPVTFIPLNK